MPLCIFYLSVVQIEFEFLNSNLIWICLNQVFKGKWKTFLPLSLSSPAQSLSFFFFFSPQPKPAQSFFLFLLSPTGRIPSRGPVPAPQPNSCSPPLSLTCGVGPSGASPTSGSNRTLGGARVRPRPAAFPLGPHAQAPGRPYKSTAPACNTPMLIVLANHMFNH